jgi:hypothetical protein
MKTFFLLASVAAFVALAFSQFSFELAISVPFAAGLGAIAVHDYRRAKSSFADASVHLAELRRCERLGLAA